VGKKNKTKLGWVVMPCSLTNKYQHFQKKETMPPPSVQKNGGGSEFFHALVGIYQTKQHHIPKEAY